MTDEIQGLGRYLCIQTNDIREGANAVLCYIRKEDGSIHPHPKNPFYTAGTGINNDTHAKLGPQDNDTPLIIDKEKRLLFTVNSHSDTVAVFNILENGALEHVSGSPFSSEGIDPNSLSLSGDILLMSNRNEDYHQVEELKGKAKASYVSFKVKEGGMLEKISKVDVENFQKPTQVHVAQKDRNLAFGNDFQVDADFDGDGDRSFQIGYEARVQGQIHSFVIKEDGSLEETAKLELPETNKEYVYEGMKDVPSLPLGLWTHPNKNILYVGFVTRNELGVFEYDQNAKLKFVTSIANSGQDICWLLTNKEGTRLYTVNNLPAEGEEASTVSTYDISGDKALKPEEISRIETPLPCEWFVNNRNFKQPGSTAFQMTLSPDEKFLYVINQRVNQHKENQHKDGNILHCFKLDDNGVPSVASSRHLMEDGVYYMSRNQGLAII